VLPKLRLLTKCLFNDFSLKLQWVFIQLIRTFPDARSAVTWHRQITCEPPNFYKHAIFESELAQR